MAHWLTQQPYGPPEGTHPLLTPLHPLQTMVDPQPHCSAPRIAQGSKDGPKTRHHGPQRTGEGLQIRLLQGHQGREEQTLVLLPPIHNPPKRVDREEVCLRPRPTPHPVPPRGRNPARDERSIIGPLLSPNGCLLPSPQAEAVQNGTPPNPVPVDYPRLPTGLPKSG